jgi:hypothetical protein
MNHEKLHDLKGNEMGGTCSTYGEKKNSCKIVIGKPEG